MHFTNLLSAAALASSVVQAHPGHDIKQEIAERAAYLKLNTRSVGNCAAQLKARGHHARTIERRSEILRREREKRGLPTDPSFYKARSIPSLDARDATTVLNTSHLSSTTYTPDTDVATLFAGNNSCILVPEVTEGPYYVSGELIRSDVRDDQTGTGIELILDVEVLDTSTCDPISDVYVDFWHCNSTGVYSGVVASGNGNTADLSNINETHHRGLQPTSDDGVAQFITNYPGHYTGRTNHIHVATHFNGTVLANNTFSGSTVSHIGQIFFDQDLTTQVEATGNYATNTQDLTTNAEDSIFTQEAALGDPVVEYSLLSDNVEDGIFAWIAFGIDVSSAETIQAAAVYGASGGYSTGNSGSGGGAGGPGGAPPTK